MQISIFQQSKIKAGIFLIKSIKKITAKINVPGTIR